MAYRALTGGLLGAAALGQPEDAEAAFLRAARLLPLSQKANPKATEANRTRAKRMEVEDVDPRIIYEQTGFFRGADGKLRYEVPELTGDDSPEKYAGVALIGREAQHPDVVDANLPEGTLGGYLPSENTIAIASGLEPEMFNSVLAHETQHALQELTGLAGGGSPRNIKQNLIEQLRDVERDLVMPNKIYNMGYDAIRNFSKLDAMTRYREMAESGNLTGKRRLLVGNSNWYEYGDDIRRELGDEPKRHRPKAERERWLQNAWHLMANKVEQEIPDYAYRDLYRLSLVPRGKLRNTIEDSIRGVYDDNQMSLLDEQPFDQVYAGREILIKDPKAARKAIEKYKRVMDQVRDEAVEFDEIHQQILNTEIADNFDLYQRIAGEVEARNVQSRLNMTPEERAASYPLDTEDVPRDKQIIAESATQKAQRGAATPRALTGTALASTAATAAAPTALDYGLGILDAAANTGSALAAGPLNAALNLGHLALPIPTDYIKQRSDDRLRALDYQPRTQIGRDIDQQFKQGAASLLGPTMQTVGDAYDRSLTKQGIDLLGQYAPRTQMIMQNLLDVIP